MPVAAVRRGGKPSVSSGSHIAIFGIMCGLMKPSLRPSFSVINAPRPTSLPVPAVVGIAISGATFAVIFASPPPINAYCSSGAGVCRQQRNGLSKIDRRAATQRDHAITTARVVKRDRIFDRLFVGILRCAVEDHRLQLADRLEHARHHSAAGQTGVGHQHRLANAQRADAVAELRTAPKSNSIVVR